MGLVIGVKAEGSIILASSGDPNPVRRLTGKHDMEEIAFVSILGSPDVIDELTNVANRFRREIGFATADSVSGLRQFLEKAECGDHGGVMLAARTRRGLQLVRFSTTWEQSEPTLFTALGDRAAEAEAVMGWLIRFTQGPELPFNSALAAAFWVAATIGGGTPTALSFSVSSEGRAFGAITPAKHLEEDVAAIGESVSEFLRTARWL